MALQIRRGTNAERLTIVPNVGEPIYATDTKKLFIGDGTTPGGVSVDTDTTLGSLSINDLSDVVTGVGDSTQPEDGEALVWSANNQRWEPGAGGGGGVAFDQSLNTTDNVTFNSVNAITLTATNGNIDSINATAGVTTPTLISTADINAVDITASGPILTTDNVTGLNIIANADISGTNATFTGSVTADSVTLNTLNVTNTIIANFDGDIKGSVFGEDSTALVNAQDGTIAASALRGSANELTQLRVFNSNSSGTLYSLGANRAFDDNNGTVLAIGKARGSTTAPAAVQLSDNLGVISFLGYKDGVFHNSASITAQADPSGTLGLGIVPGKLIFSTVNNSGTPIARATIDKDGTFQTFGISVGSTTAPTGIPFYSLQNTNIAGDGARFLMRRSRGTFDVPTSVVDGDALHRVVFGGHDGSNYNDTAIIKAEVSGTVSTGVVPTKLSVSTTDSTGATNVAITVNADATTDFNAAVKLATYADAAARDATITSPSAGQVVFLVDGDGGGNPQFQGYTGTVWVSLN